MLGTHTGVPECFQRETATIAEYWRTEGKRQGGAELKKRKSTDIAPRGGGMFSAPNQNDDGPHYEILVPQEQSIQNRQGSNNRRFFLKTI